MYKALDTKRYSIPNNYIVFTNNNGLSGLMRKDKRGDKVLWEPYYRILLVGKVYGRILVAYQGLDPEQPMKIASYNNKESLNIPVYDILFGENCLWVKTMNWKDNEQGWCLVRQGLSGGLYVGNIEFIERETFGRKIYIPIGKKYTRVKLENGEIKRIELESGVIDEDPQIELEKKREREKALENAPLTHYNASVIMDTKQVIFKHPINGKILLRTMPIGDIQLYMDIIKILLGVEDNSEVTDKGVVVSLEAGRLFVKLTHSFEGYFDGSILMILYYYVRGRNKEATVIEVLQRMINEVQIGNELTGGEETDRGWLRDNYGNLWKIFISKTVIEVLVKRKDSIIVGRGIIDEETFSDAEVTYMVQAMQASGHGTIRLNPTECELTEVENNEEVMRRFMKPYAIEQREVLLGDIASYRYSELDTYSIFANTVDDAGNIYGEIEVVVDIGKEFQYISKKKVNGKSGSYISVNTDAVILR